MKSKNRDPFLAGIKAALKVSAARGSSTTFHRRGPAPQHPVHILKTSDFIAPENMSLWQRLDEITPSAAGGPMSAKMRDKLRRKHGLPT